MTNINFRDRKVILVLLAFFSLTTFLVIYYFLNRSTETRSRASLSNTLDLTGISSESEIKKDDTSHISLYKEKGYLYKTQGKGDISAREFIQKNPHYESPQELRKPLMPGRGKSVLGASNNTLLPQDIQADLTLGRSVDDAKDTIYKKSALKVDDKHYFYNQSINDIPVFGASLAVHIRNENEVYAIDANLSSQKATTTSILSIEQAQQIALSQARKDATTSANLKVTEAKKYIFNPAVLGLSLDSTNYVTQAITVGSDSHTLEPFLTKYFVDLDKGKILYSFSLIEHVLNRKVRDPSNCTGDAYNNPTSCQIKRGEGAPAINDNDVNNTYDFLGQIYNFYKNNYGRDSYDNKGVDVNSLPHSPYSCPNAFWNGQAVYFCNGWAVNDIVGHEYTHAVTEHTANLFYLNQSGALNESISDIFGYAIDPDWSVGEDLSTGRLRSFSNPPIYNQPDRVFSSKYYCGSGDSGGVHYNSGVMNKTFYLMTDGENFNGCSVTGVGSEKSLAIVYRALTTYLTYGSNFYSMYTMLNRSCNDLYGEASNTCVQVKKATQATEMDQQPANDQNGPVCKNVASSPATCNLNAPTPTPTTPPAPTPTPGPPIPSPEGKIVYSIYTNNESQIYTSNPDGSNQRQLTFSEYNYHPTFSNDGKTIALIQWNTGTDESKIVITDRLGGNAVSLAVLAGGVATLRFAPDDQILFFTHFSFTERIWKIYKMKKDGTGLSVIKQEPDNSNLLLYDISPDGKKILYTKTINSQNDIFMSDIDGTHEENVTNTNKSEWEPTFSPDGKYILFVVDNSFYHLNLQTKETKLIIKPSNSPYTPSYSPNGNKIIFMMYDPNVPALYTMNADGSNMTKITPANKQYSLGTNAWENDPDAGPPATPTPTTIPTLTPTPTPKSSPTPQPSPVPSADGKIIFISYDNPNSYSDIFTVNPDGTNRRIFIERPDFVDFSPTFSSDGKTVAFASYNPKENSDDKIIIANNRGEIISTISSPSIHYVNKLLLTPTGELLVSTYANGKYGIYKIDKTGNNLTLLYEQSDYFDLEAISPDGTKILFASYGEAGTNIFKNIKRSEKFLAPAKIIQEKSGGGGGGKSDIYFINIDGTNKQNITNTPDSYEFDGDFLPDGKSIVFVKDYANNEYDIAKMNLADSSITRITNSSNLNKSQLAVSPDGKKITFSGYTITDYIFYIYIVSLDGLNLHKITNNVSYLTSSGAWEPDPEYKAPTPTPGKTGDINNDGQTDILDFNIWLCEFLGNGTCANPPSNKTADLNSDGTVDILDFVIWKNAFQP